MLEERRHLREQTPRRELDKKIYQPRRLIELAKIELGLPRTVWTPHRDSAPHEIYPIPEDEGEGEQITKGTHRIGKEHQDLRENQVHSPLETMAQEEVLKLKEEEEEEMNPVIPVETKD